jgi:hypothetical protein
MISVMDNPSHAVLHLATDDAPDPQDIPPLYSPGPIANVAELALSSIIHTLNRENILYVGLFGTDTRDKLFLARLIRSYHPNIQFFTNDSDILYAHPNYTADLWGMLIASTYPLVPQSQTWIRDEAGTPSPEVIRQFSSQSAASAHNAASIAVGREELENQAGANQEYLMVQGTNSGTHGGMVDYNDPFHPNNKLPLVWLTAVGNESLWPISVRDPWGTSDAIPVSGTLNIRQSRSFLLLFIIATLFCMVHCYEYLHTKRVWAAEKPTHPQYRMFEPVPARPQRFGILGFFLLLLLGYTAIAALVLLPSTDTHGWFEFIRLTALAAEGILAFSALETVRSFLPSGKTWQILAFSIQCLVGIAAVVTLAVLSRAAILPEHVMLFERTTHLGSGISPILPALFLIFALGAGLVCFLRRTQITVYRDNVNPYPRDTDDPFHKLYLKISDALHPIYVPKSRGVGITMAALCVAALSWAAWESFFATIEGKRFDLVIFCLFLILIVGLFWAAFHFMAIWYHLRQLLEQVAFNRLAPAFVRLDAKLSRGLSTSLLESPPPLVELAEPLETLTAIRDQFALVNKSWLNEEQSKCIPADLDNMVKEISESLTTERSLALNREIPLEALPSKTQKMLCEASGKLFAVLRSYWETNPFHNRPEPEKAAIAEGFKLSENFVASQTVAHFNYVFMTLRYLFACTGSSVVFLVLATSAYPFRTQTLMMDFAWVVLLLFAAVHVTMFMQMDRSEILRAIANQQDKSTFNRAVVGQAIVFGVIPALMFLGSKFPTLGRILFAWVSPALKTIKFQ